MTSLRSCARSALAVALLVCVPWLAGAVPSHEKAEPVPQHASLAGRLLVAAPTMPDPRFARTVVLMVEHNARGAFGVIVNRPAGERPLALLLESLGEKDTTVSGNVSVFAGGPVQPEVGFVLHSADYRGAGTLHITDQIALTSSRQILLDIGNNKGPQKSLIAFGYAGWAPGQLEGEIEHGAWLMAPAEPKIVFDEERDRVWDAAYARRMQDL
jgi:putative transcriptional regulator